MILRPPRGRNPLSTPRRRWANHRQPVARLRRKDYSGGCDDGSHERRPLFAIAPLGILRDQQGSLSLRAAEPHEKLGKVFAAPLVARLALSCAACRGRCYSCRNATAGSMRMDLRAGT